MTNKELQEFLKQYPDDMEVFMGRNDGVNHSVISHVTKRALYRKQIQNDVIVLSPLRK